MAARRQQRSADREAGVELRVLDERQMRFESRDGMVLEAMLHVPPQPSLAALVMHPHPQYGGDMDNHVVLAMRDAMAAAGAATLRFNVRGAGASSGSFDPVFAGDDAISALGALTKALPALPIVLAGYSYGAQLAAGLAVARPVTTLILVSPPLAYAPLPVLPASLRILAIAGDADPVCPPDRLRTLTASGADVRVVPGVDHGWSFATDVLSVAMRTFCEDAHT